MRSLDNNSNFLLIIKWCISLLKLNHQWEIQKKHLKSLIPQIRKDKRVYLKLDIKRFQSNWNYKINMGNSKSKEQESLLARTSREFWYVANMNGGFNKVFRNFAAMKGKTSESSTLVPTGLEEM